MFAPILCCTIFTLKQRQPIGCFDKKPPRTLPLFLLLQFPNVPSYELLSDMRRAGKVDVPVHVQQASRKAIPGEPQPHSVAPLNRTLVVQQAVRAFRMEFRPDRVG